jgi:uncharacterized C2H2 Zn-finger protein
MEAIGATGISSPSTVSISLKTAVNTKNIHEMQITKDGKKIPINTSSYNNQSKDISKFRCVVCRVVFKDKTAIIRHLNSIHRKQVRFKGEYYKIIADLPPKPRVNCPECEELFKDKNSLRGHLNAFHNLKSIFSGNVIISTTHKITGGKKIYNFTNNIQAINIKESTPKSQDNTNATNTTTNNMVSNRKRSHSPAIHEEESNAKKAMFNSSESGYPQSAPASENIDDKELLELVQQLVEADNNFKTDVIKCTDICSTDVQLSATSENIDDKELLELVQELIQTNNDLNTGELSAKAFTSGII